uniref:Uncharacterized protein n=1 Tax=Anguilla anguilla TaxID=7936 RepID=A0A0E9QKP9_ANGAN
MLQKGTLIRTLTLVDFHPRQVPPSITSFRFLCLFIGESPVV